MRIKHFGYKEFLSSITDDLSVAEKQLGQSNNQPLRRQYLRAFVTLVEGVSYINRRLALMAYDLGQAKFSNSELSVLKEEQYQLKDNGEAIARPRLLPLKANFRFTWTMYARAFKKTKPLPFEGPVWAEFTKVIEMRNRITHPRKASDMELSDEELQTLRKVARWYKQFTLEFFGS